VPLLLTVCRAVAPQLLPALRRAALLLLQPALHALLGSYAAPQAQSQPAHQQPAPVLALLPALLPAPAVPLVATETACTARSHNAFQSTGMGHSKHQDTVSRSVK
jgi:hypothetical protein